MGKTAGQVFVFMLLVLGTFLLIGKSLTDLTGGEKKAAATGKVEISPEGGEAIYWGRGRCFTCHSVGDRGSAVRGPNHGQFGAKFAEPMGPRAALRAKERSAKTGKTYSDVDYLVESLADPGAYIVEGYKNEMAVVFAPPISLGLDEIKAVVAYLQAQGGEFDAKAINEPSDISQAFYARIAISSQAGGGDPEKGKTVYEDNCADCHSLDGEPGEVGPDLSAIGAKGLKFVAESILRPAAKITPGFETFVAINKRGRKTVGLKTREEDGEVDITTKDGDVVTLKKSDLKELNQDKLASVMPEDLSSEISVKDYQDILSFLLLQKGAKPNEKKE